MIAILKQLLGRCVVGEERGRVGQLDLQMGRPGVGRDLLPLAQNAANQIEVAVAVYGRLDQVGERPAAHEGLVGGVGGSEDADQVGVRLGGPLGREGRSSARQRDQRRAEG